MLNVLCYSGLGVSNKLGVQDVSLHCSRDTICTAIKIDVGLCSTLYFIQHLLYYVAVKTNTELHLSVPKTCSLVSLFAVRLLSSCHLQAIFHTVLSKTSQYLLPYQFCKMSVIYQSWINNKISVQHSTRRYPFFLFVYAFLNASGQSL